MLRGAALLLLVISSASHCVVARQGFGIRGTHCASSSRQLLQAPTSGSGNCTPPRTFEDAKKPFCFVPQTISTQAQQFLSQSAAAAGPFGVTYTTDPVQQASTVAKLRVAFEQLSADTTKAAEAKYIERTRNGTIGGVQVLYAVPKGVNATLPADTKLLLYVHGGGYSVGSCRYQLSTAAPTAALAGLTIICPEYRLAPEHPFPAGLNDVLAVYKALITQEGYKPQNIAILGDSAGGGMVPPVAIQLKREGVALPAALGMFSPFSDARSRGDTATTLVAVDPLLPGFASGDAVLASLVGVYLANNASLLDDPLVSPIEADYAALFPDGSLPPSLIQVGLRELLLSDAVRLYHKMKAAAPAPGHVVISPYEGMWHVFQQSVGVPEAEVAAREMADYLTRALKGGICK